MREDKGFSTHQTQPPSVDAGSPPAPPEKAFSEFPPTKCTACRSAATYFCRPAPSDPTVIFGVCESHYWTAVIAGWKPQPIETPPVEDPLAQRVAKALSAALAERGIYATTNADIDAIADKLTALFGGTGPTDAASVDDAQRMTHLQKGQPNG